MRGIKKILTGEALLELEASMPALARHQLGLARTLLSKGLHPEPRLAMEREGRIGVIDFDAKSNHMLMLYQLTFTRMKIEGISAVFMMESLPGSPDGLAIFHFTPTSHRTWTFDVDGKKPEPMTLKLQGTTEGQPIGRLANLMVPFELGQVPAHLQADIVQGVEEFERKLLPLFDGAPSTFVHEAPARQQ